MPIWTVDTWKIRPGAESHFFQPCSALSPEPLTLFRDLEKPGLFWSPAGWESRDTLKNGEEAFDITLLCSSLRKMYSNTLLT